jgi:hypothetical protein
MSTTLTLVTQVRAVIQRPLLPPPPSTLPPAPTVLRLSPLLRYALATAQPRADGRPLLLPETLPPRCCHGLWTCRARVKWRIGDGRNRVLFCETHGEEFWLAGNDVLDYTIERWVS